MQRASFLKNRLLSGMHRMGELRFQSNVHGSPYVLCHWLDTAQSQEPEWGGLERHEGPESAHNLAMDTQNGHCRFLKARADLRRGWVMLFQNPNDLRQALDQFYPAGVGLFFAHENGTLEIDCLRATLDRQTGMYRSASLITDAAAQQLVQNVCRGTHPCAKRILWAIDANTPLDHSEPDRFPGRPDGLSESEAIPLLCREACNHFVEECRKAVKAATGPNGEMSPPMASL